MRTGSVMGAMPVFWEGCPTVGTVPEHPIGCRFIPTAWARATHWLLQGCPCPSPLQTHHLNHFPLKLVAGSNKAVSMWTAVSPCCHGNSAGCHQAEDRIIWCSPRAAGTSNPASLHFTPLWSTKELSNDQLSGSKQVLGRMRHCLLLLFTR